MKISTINKNNYGKKTLKQNDYMSMESNLIQQSFAGVRTRTVKIPANKLALALAAGLAVITPAIAQSTKSPTQAVGVAIPKNIESSKTLDLFMKDEMFEKRNKIGQSLSDFDQILFVDAMGSKILNYYAKNPNIKTLLSLDELSKIGNTYCQENKTDFGDYTNILAKMYTEYKNVMKTNNSSAEDAVFALLPGATTYYVIGVNASIISTYEKTGEIPTPTPENIKKIMSKAKIFYPKISEDEDFTFFPKDLSALAPLVISKALGSYINEWLDENPTKSIEDLPFDTQNGLQYYLAWSENRKQPNIRIEPKSPEARMKDASVALKKSEITGLKDQLSSNDKAINDKSEQVKKIDSEITDKESNYSQMASNIRSLETSISRFKLGGDYVSANLYQSQVNIWQGKNMDLAWEIRKLKTTKQDIEKEISGLKQSNSDLQKQIKDINAEIETMTAK